MEESEGLKLGCKLRGRRRALHRDMPLPTILSLEKIKLKSNNDYSVKKPHKALNLCD